MSSATFLSVLRLRLADTHSGYDPAAPGSPSQGERPIGAASV
jgi:hypothetical protein